MWIPDLKTNQALAIAALGLTAGLPATAASDSFAVGVCRTARQIFPAAIRPTYSAGSYLEMYRKGVSKEDDPFYGAKVSLLVKPKHGAVKLEEGQLAVDSSWYKYYPQAGFEGTDRFVMQVEKSGIKVKIYYVIKALDDVEATAGYCPKEFWKISLSDFKPGTQDYAAEKKGGRSLIIMFSQDIAMARSHRLEFARVGLHYTSISRFVKLALK